MTIINLYDLFNLLPNCSKKEIRDAYHKELVKIHPEWLHCKKELNLRYETLVHAYNILIDDNKRCVYNELYGKSLQKDNYKDKIDELEKKRDNEILEITIENIIIEI